MNKKLIKAKIFTWSIVAISLSIVFVSLLIGTIISHSFNFPFNILNPKYNYDNYIVAKNESFSDKINDINVDWISGEVRIKRSDSNKIKLIQKIPSNFSKKKLAKIMVDGDSLSIYDNSAKKFFIGINLPKPTILELYLPNKLYDKITLYTTSADIYSTYIRSNTVEANTVSGAIGLSGNINKINLDTTSGHIDIAKLNSKNATLKSTSGEIQLSGKIDVLNLETTNGDINLKDIYNKNLTCSSVSGKMNLSGVFSDIKAESTSSNIKITSSKMLSSLYCETTSANVDLSIPDNPGFTLNFDKVSGVLDSDFELNRHSDLYTYKNGITDLYLSTTNGNLTIIKNNH
ncbi:DUF4097 family beta strand repeat-containing protein [Clostridioides difficile]|uniref:DUF4097 family beta strand repeat-containing protein n=1 Tax=Clostridioides difficile TaxID=1496 RepID=UPI001C1AB2AE|nr:DUF4097 family beta strand repeat-containing protein [Clostridioides difficile]MCI9995206.1 DUF4097 family beta strand repeat protein [Clostridioides difficile]MCJ0056611.1 DUF4097 family beta strand repeat protein [Clostridioides difficile]MCR1466169.1 DUF4097 domain-containing protein [Clostridioides difficile]MCU5872169.1 DUF4097 family beta strand repeat protein [Clostridioides difficile]MCU5898493.1 DUF4097 family beta strand repeat protein [Clostridioides difficile]